MRTGTRGDSSRVANLPAGALGDNLFIWGLWDLLIAVLALSARYSLLSGNTFGRVIGYAWAVLVIVQSFLVIQVRTLVRLWDAADRDPGDLLVV